MIRIIISSDETAEGKTFFAGLIENFLKNLGQKVRNFEVVYGHLEEYTGFTKVIDEPSHQSEIQIFVIDHYRKKVPFRLKKEEEMAILKVPKKIETSDTHKE